MRAGLKVSDVRRDFRYDKATHRIFFKATSTFKILFSSGVVTISVSF